MSTLNKQPKRHPNKPAKTSRDRAPNDSLERVFPKLRKKKSQKISKKWVQEGAKPKDSGARVEESIQKEFQTQKYQVEIQNQGNPFEPSQQKVAQQALVEADARE